MNSARLDSRRYDPQQLTSDRTCGFCGKIGPLSPREGNWEGVVCWSDDLNCYCCGPCRKEQQKKPGLRP